MNLFKDLVWDNLVRASLEAIFTRFPILGIKPIREIISFFVLRYSDKLYGGVETFIDVKKITFKNEKLHKEFNVSAAKLKIVAKGYGIESQEFLETKKIYKKTLADFVRFYIH